ncbi:MAG: hypothetical protein ACKOW9_03255, partial [Candidatus Paceibacterota bacterium]
GIEQDQVPLARTFELFDFPEHENVANAGHCVILTDLPKDVLYKIPSHQTKLIVDALGFITSQSLPKDITNDFKLGEDQYTLKPFDTLTMGEIISLEMLIKNINNNIAGIISILFSKNGEPFDLKTHEANAELIANKMTIGQLYGCVLFFCEVFQKLKENSHLFTATPTMKKPNWIKRKFNSFKTMVVMYWLRGWRRGTFWHLKKFTN